MPILSAPEGAISVSIGATCYPVVEGRIEAAVEHVESLLCHGYVVIAAEAKKMLSGGRKQAAAAKD